MEREFDLWIDTLGEEKYTEFYNIAKTANGGNAVTIKDLFDCAKYENRIATIMYSVFRFVELYWRRVVEYIQSEQAHGESVVANAITALLKKKNKDARNIMEAIKKALFYIATTC